MTYEQAHKDYEKSMKEKRGSINGTQAMAADIIGRKWCLIPKKLYEWGQKHEFDLREILKGKITVDAFTEAVLNDNRLSINEMTHPIIGDKFDPDERMWQVIVDAPKHPRLVSYPGSGQSLYNFYEAVQVCESICNGHRDAWLECKTMRMDLETALSIQEVR